MFNASLHGRESEPQITISKVLMLVMLVGFILTTLLFSLVSRVYAVNNTNNPISQNNNFQLSVVGNHVFQAMGNYIFLRVYQSMED